MWKRFSKVQPSTCGSLCLAVCPVLACDRERDIHRERERERDGVVGVWEIDKGIRGCLYVRHCTCSHSLPIAKHTHCLSFSHTLTYSDCWDTSVCLNRQRASFPLLLLPPPPLFSPVCWTGPTLNTDAALARFNLCCSTATAKTQNTSPPPSPAHTL